MFPRSGVVSGKSGIDISKIVPVASYATSGTLTQNVWTSVVSITGRGFLDLAAIKGTSGSVNYGIQITLDGILVHSSTTNSAVNQSGITCLGTCTYFNVAAYTYFNFFYAAGYSLGAQQPYPYTAAGNGYVMIPYPLPFKKSCLVEIKNLSNTNGIDYCFMGGTY